MLLVCQTVVAATSMFGDTYPVAPYPEYTGCQVLRKDTSSAEWQVDVSFGAKYLRTDSLEVIQFTRDEFGTPITVPPMLVAGIWDLGNLPGGTGRFVSVAIREGSGTNVSWHISNVVPVPDDEVGFASVRAMALHRDNVTGAQYLFVGGAYGGVFKGVYRTPFEMRMAALPGDAAQKAFGADLDGDGLANGVEFAFGLNPNNPADRAGWPRPDFNFSTGFATMSVTEPPGIWGIHYGAQYSEDLRTWMNLTDTGTAPAHVFSLPLLNRPQLFMRWVITSD